MTQETTNVSPPKAAMPAEAHVKIQALKTRFQGAIGFLQKINQVHLPWYLMIGPKNAGKTSLLANANIPFVLAKKFAKEMLHAIPPSETCDWWVTQHLVLVDIPSHFTRLNKKAHYPLWKTLLSLIHQHKFYSMPHGLVIALPLPELMQNPNPQQLNALTAEIKQRILDVRHLVSAALPCHFIITKCDLMPGFLDFFSENSKEEAEQIWGITLPSLKQEEKITDMLAHRFNALIQRINKQLILRLHQERNPVSRIFIKDFPLQIERMKDVFIQFVKALKIHPLQINTVFFTSSTQPETPNNKQNQPVTITQQQTSLQLLQTPRAPTKPYFVRDVILQGLLHSATPYQDQIKSKKIHFQNKIALGIATSVILSAVIIFGYDFKQGASRAYAIEHHLKEYQHYIRETDLTNDHITKMLPLLNSLRDAAFDSNKPITHFAFYTTRSSHSAQSIYLKALQALLLPEIKLAEETYLQQSSENNPVQLYNVLKAYLMLSNPSLVNPEHISNTLSQIGAISLTKNELAHLNQHLHTLFVAGHTLPLNNEIVATARKELTQIPRTDLAYIILKSLGNNNLDSSIQLGTATHVFESKALANTIPNMFTASGFQSILNGGIQTASLEANKGNWVIGDLVPLQSADPLAAQLQSTYVTNYIDIWESQLANIKLYSPKDLAELDSMLNIITSNKSPLLELLQTIRQNTAFGIITSASPKLHNLNALLANAGKNEGNQLYQMFLSMRDLHVFVQHIAESHDVGNAAFIASKLHTQKTTDDPISRMNTLSQITPEPMKTWLLDLSNISWRLISTTAGRYIDITMVSKAKTRKYQRPKYEALG